MCGTGPCESNAAKCSFCGTLKRHCEGRPRVPRQGVFFMYPYPNALYMVHARQWLASLITHQGNYNEIGWSPCIVLYTWPPSKFQKQHTRTLHNEHSTETQKGTDRRPSGPGQDYGTEDTPRAKNRSTRKTKKTKRYNISQMSAGNSHDTMLCL